MSVLWSKLIMEVELRVAGVAEVRCPLCRTLLGEVTGIVLMAEVTNMAMHQCPNVWDILERHLLDNTGTLGFTVNGVPDPVPPQVDEPSAYRVATRRST